MYAIGKRVSDVVLATVLLFCLSPLLFTVLLLIRTESQGNPVFTQWRVGRGGVPFRIYKFRTMYSTAPCDVATAALPHPERHITRVGRILRRTSVDELPQLWNILKGDMSFVGPRPVVLTEYELLQLRKIGGADRVRPGMTGLAQVHGRNQLTVSEKARYDIRYAQNPSLRTDIRILLATAQCLVTQQTR